MAHSAAPPKSPHPPYFYIFCKTQSPHHPAWGNSQNTTEGRKPLSCVPSTESPLATGDNLVLEVGISGFFVVPHDAVLHRQVLELAVVADSHVRADGAVLDGDILPDDARGNQPGIVNGIPLVDGGAADAVEFVLVLQQPCVRLHKGLGKPAVQPFADRRRAELTTLLDHHLQSVSQLELTTSADVVIHQLFQRCAKFLDILDVIDADNSLVTHKFLRLFYKSFDTPVLVSDHHTKTSGILHLVSVQDILVFARELPKVYVEQRVTENDEQGFVIIHIRECKTYCLPQALRVVLEHGAGLAPFGPTRQVAVHDFGLVAGNEDCLGGGQQPGIPPQSSQ